jgi:hypothetical protein
VQPPHTRASGRHGRAQSPRARPSGAHAGAQRSFVNGFARHFKTLQKFEK